jgi:ABC-type glycerol-3-phosphate transport system permease component
MGHGGSRWAARGAVALALAFALFPVYWIVLTAFRPRGEIFTHPAKLLPSSFTLENVRTVWLGSATSDPILPFLWTSLLVAGAATLLATALGVLCAYGMARHRAGGRAFAMWMLSQRFLPAVALIVPLFVLFRKLSLFDTYTGLILLYTTVNVPLAVWLMLGFVEGLPADLEEAALIDGASYAQAFRKVALPLLRPGIAVTALFVFIFSWNEFLFAYQLAGDEVATVTVYLPRLRSAIAELYGEISAAALLSVLPACAFAWVLQHHLVHGLAFGGGRET